MQAKNWIQVYKAEVTFLFPRMNPRQLSFKVTEEALGNWRGELLQHIFLYLIVTFNLQEIAEYKIFLPICLYHDNCFRLREN